MAIGYKEYAKFQRGEPLTHKQAILAQCYICNGLDEGGKDCRGISCPLYQHMPYRAGRIRAKKAASPQQLEALRLARQAKRSNS